MVQAPRSRGQLPLAYGLLSEVAGRRGRPREFLLNSVALRRTQLEGAGKAAVTMAATTDSAFVAAFWDGNPSEARTLLRRASAPTMVSAVAPSSRAWREVLRVAALAEDTASARLALAGYLRDQSAFSDLRMHDDAMANAYLAIAAKRFDESVAQLRLAVAQRASPDNEEAFLLAMSHERAGRADSAIVWLQRAITTPTEVGDRAGTLQGATLQPLAQRRLAELLDAKGDLRGALPHYEAFLASWSNPEPEQAVIVRAVKARVAELRAKLSPG